jgi:hypothetical protein
MTFFTMCSPTLTLRALSFRDLRVKEKIGEKAICFDQNTGCKPDPKNSDDRSTGEEFSKIFVHELLS